MPPAIAARMALDHQFDLQRPVRPECHHRLAAAGIFPDGPVAGRRVLRATATTTPPSTSQILRELWETGVSDLKGEFFTMNDCRLSPRPQGRHEDHLRRPERRRPGVHRQVRRLQLLLRQGHQHADRLRDTVERLQQADAPGPAARSRSYGLFMIITGETDAEAEAKWELYKDGRRPRGAGLAGRSRRRPTPESGRRHQRAPHAVEPKSTVNLNIGLLLRLACQGGAHAGRDGDRPGPGRRAADLRRVRERHRDLRRAHPAADEVPPARRLDWRRPPHDRSPSATSRSTILPRATCRRGPSRS